MLVCCRAVTRQLKETSQPQLYYIAGTFCHTRTLPQSATVTGTAKPGASLPECEQLCDADTLCKGIYHEAQPGADSCFALHELVVDGHTAHTGQSFTRVHRDVAARLSPNIDSHVETMDLMLPVARKAQHRSGDDGGRRVLEWNRQ